MSIFDAIWRRRGRHSKYEEEFEVELPVRHITMTDRDYSGLLEYGDVAIKFWLPDLMQDLGKNTEDLKVWIPLKMKEDIQALADKASISLSEMIREILLSMLIGHTYLAARKELMQMEIEIEEEAAD